VKKDTTQQNIRCGWAKSPGLIAYHDKEWGVETRDDRTLFELLTLEGAQAGLNWATILRKRDAYRKAFHGFAIERVARMTQRDIESLLRQPTTSAPSETSIVRNRAKVASTIGNAQAALAIIEEHGSLGVYLWSFVDGAPIINQPIAAQDVPAKSARSHAMSRSLRDRGMRFVGPTICYAFMQATGMVDDHLVDCFRKRSGVKSCKGLEAQRRAPRQ